MSDIIEQANRAMAEQAERFGERICLLEAERDAWKRLYKAEKHFDRCAAAWDNGRATDEEVDVARIQRDEARKAVEGL